jgi:hypothetical protein
MTERNKYLIPEIRFLIGFLGEKSQRNWWSSSFVGPTSEAFLGPIFPRTIMLARYHGICESAMRVHDDHIGVGANYHLYRLPDSMERSAAKELMNADTQALISAALSDQNHAITRLKELASGQQGREEGAIAVGDYSDAGLQGLLHQAAGHYLRAFEGGYQCFPFMRAAD